MVRSWFNVSVCLAATALMGAWPVRGDDKIDVKKADVVGHSERTVELAKQICNNTVTVRISSQADVKKAAKAKEDADGDHGKFGVTVCSGIALGRGRIVTFSTATPASRYRITLPQGDQAEAKLEVVDYYSGLLLLRIERGKLPGIARTDVKPQVGATIITAAAAGLEGPAVSVGTVSATQRTIGRRGLPPLLECDVRTTETSSGAGVIDVQGRLVGIVAATDSDGQRQGWTYAVPVSHITRLVRSVQEGRLVELKRRRPTVGWTLGPGDDKDSVVIYRVVEGGPAAKAGIKRGCVLLETEQRRIRNAYQAVNLILKKQPGDNISCVVQENGKPRKVEVTLGGAASVPASSFGANERELYPLDLLLRMDNKQRLEKRRVRMTETELLRRQLDAYQMMLKQQQGELKRRAKQQTETDERLKQLRKEISKLKDESK